MNDKETNKLIVECSSMLDIGLDVLATDRYNIESNDDIFRFCALQAEIKCARGLLSDNQLSVETAEALIIAFEALSYYYSEHGWKCIVIGIDRIINKLKQRISICSVK